jgi:hypothetical protein
MTATATSRKPVVANHYSVLCELCNAPVIRPHKHADGSWYSESNDPGRPQKPWLHRQWWDHQTRSYRCSCEWGQIHTGSVKPCAHVQRIEPLIAAGLDREPGPVVVEAVGELFEDHLNQAVEMVRTSFCRECGAAIEPWEARVELFVFGGEQKYHAACAPDVPDDGGDDEEQEESYASLFERLLTA